MKIKPIIFLAPLIAAAELYCFSGIAGLLSEPSDAAVFAGIALACGFIAGNYYLIKSFRKTK